MLAVTYWVVITALQLNLCNTAFKKAMGMLVFVSFACRSSSSTDEDWAFQRVSSHHPYNLVNLLPEKSNIYMLTYPKLLDHFVLVVVHMSFPCGSKFWS